MSLSVDQLLEIQDLPSFLRADHCFNDLQHAMLVILFRHGLTALRNDKKRYADQLIDSMTIYLFIHFLNEEEGMAFNMEKGLIDRSGLSEHSETHLKFLDFWKNSVLMPYKNGTINSQGALEGLSAFYNYLIKHIDEVDKNTYGPTALTEDNVRTELARVSKTNMPMSPFMVGAYDTVKILAPDVAATITKKYLSPMALRPLNKLDLVQNVGRVLNSGSGSLRDRFATATRGDASVTSGREFPMLQVA